MRILVTAADCNPDWPSLPVVGYKMARALGDHAEVVVATHVRNRDAIATSGFGRCTVEFIDNEYVAKPMFKLATLLRGGSSVAWTTNIAMAYAPYLAFEREVWKRFRGDLRGGRFDLVHRVTPMSPTLPSPLAKWSPVPFVLGPLNGGLRWPEGFREELSREREFLTYLRGAYRHLPYHRSTYSRSAAVLGGFRHTIDDLPAHLGERAFNVAEVGVDPGIFGSEPRTPRTPPLTFLFAGRLVPYKCPDLAVEAFAAQPSLRAHVLRIVGDGPELPRLREMVERNGLADCVRFAGRLSQAGVADEMRRADVFVFPSIRELGAGVVVEAMASGLACVVVDYGAPGALVGDDRGVRLPLGTKSELSAALGSRLAELAGDPVRIAALGERASRYVREHYVWDAKARSVIPIYEWILGRRAERPVTLLEQECGIVGR